MDKKKAQFTSSWGFVLSAVGSAVGMANVWGFPAKMGQNGGGAFLVAYLIFIALFSVVGLSAEYAVGRRAHTGTLGAYQMAWASRKKALGTAGGVLGWLPLAGSMCIAIGYAAIVAYVLKAFASSINGSLMHVDTGTWFEGFSTADYSVLPFHIIVVVGTLLTLLLGARSIEKTNKVMMPVSSWPCGCPCCLARRRATAICSPSAGRNCWTPWCGSGPWDRPSSPCPSPAAA